MDNANSSQFAAEGATLAWLADAGLDTLVDDGPRNWLAAPPRAATMAATADVRTRSAPLPTTARPGADSDAAALARDLSHAAETLDTLIAAVAGFDHPLRRHGEVPRLFSGSITSGIIVIADQPEAPGSDSDRLRGRMLAAIGLGDGNHGILNLLPWPTIDNGAPRESQIADFAPFVARALTLGQPTLLLALGTVAASLAGPVRGIASARGRWRDVGGVPLLTTYHPRSLIAQPAQKPLAWADLQAFAERMSRKPQ